MVMRAMTMDTETNVNESQATAVGHECRPAKGDAAPQQPEPITEAEQIAVPNDEVGSTAGNRPHGGHTPQLPVLLTVDDVAALLRCSPRTVHRLTERGRIPRPCRLGSLLRWPRVQVEAWVDQGCPDCRRSGRQDSRKN